MGKEIDAVEYYSRKLHGLERKIYMAQARQDSTFQPDSSCFLAFEDVHSAHATARAIREAKPWSFGFGPQLDLCPNFDDIIWKNIGLSNASKLYRKVIAFFAMLGLVIFWILIAICINNLSSIVLQININQGFAKVLGKNQTWIIFVQAILTPSVMAIFNLCLPYTLQYVSRVEGIFSGAAVDKSSLVKYFSMQIYLLIVHIITAFIDSLVSTIVGSMEHPLGFFIRQFLNRFVSVTKLN